MPSTPNTNSDQNASNDIDGSAFGSDGVHDDDGQNVIALSDLLNAKGGNGNGNGKKPPPPPDPDPEPDPEPEPYLPETYISGPIDPVTGEVDPTTGYNIEIQFQGEGWTTDLEAAFQDAANLLSSLISGDRPDYFGSPSGFFDQDIDDILIIATMTAIDGEGGILGQAGPTHIIWRNGETQEDALPFAGIMEFDVADAGNFSADLWGAVVLHEMMHVLGFGTMWDNNNIVETFFNNNGTRRGNDDFIDYNYLGEAATYINETTFSNEGGPLIETDGGSGTAGGHWDEDEYGNELMTGYINTSGNYFSEMSIAALQDLGYDLTDPFVALV